MSATTILCVPGVGHAKTNKNSEHDPPWNELGISPNGLVLSHGIIGVQILPI
ncbi:MAG TPA: hypothetical protein VFO40_25250 [Chthoniobacterales bacterium]|nr:hypothetical protein [Chthoniobacterales bacterium]